MKRAGPWASLRGSRAWLLCAAAILGASTVGAGEPSTESRVTACAGIPEGGERLACYDRLAKEIFARAKPIASTPAAAEPAAPAVSSAPASPALASPVAASPVPATPAPSAAAQVAAVPAAAAAPNGAAQAMFGLNGRSLSTPTADTSLRYITARVTRLRALGPGGFVMELDNGQTWEQVESTDLHLQEGDSVKIARAALGSFWLTTTSHRGARVKRVR